jgi:hypothetical protein
MSAHVKDAPITILRTIENHWIMGLTWRLRPGWALAQSLEDSGVGPVVKVWPVR